MKPFTSAISAVKAMSIAPTLIASVNPSLVPRAAASTRFASVRSILNSTPPDVTGVSVSGTISFATSSDAGADTKHAAARCPPAFLTNGSIQLVYNASTPVAMFANPATMMHISSERVAAATNGLINRGASVWPTKMLAAAESVSAPLVFIVLLITHARACTTYCITPTW
jgi:hypothetical protein